MNPSYVKTLYRQIALAAAVLETRPNKLYYRRGDKPRVGKDGRIGPVMEEEWCGITDLVSIEEKKRMEM